MFNWTVLRPLLVFRQGYQFGPGPHVLGKQAQDLLADCSRLICLPGFEWLLPFEDMHF